MNKDIVKGHWHEIKGKIKKNWGKLTDDKINEMEGTYEELSGEIQRAYGYQKDKAKDEINKFLEKNNWKD